MALTRWITAGGLAGLVALGGFVEPASAQKKISVLTWNIPVYKPKIDGWIEDFKKIHPDVQVEWLDKKGTEWATFYQTQVVGGTAPDIIDVQGALWLEYAANGGLVDLTPYLARDPQVRDSYNGKFLATWVYQGKNYMVPFYISKTLLFMNNTMMKDAGLTRAPQTFDELMDYARKMTKGEKSGFMTLNFDWLYWSLFAMNGVELLTPDGRKAAFNTPAAVKALEALAKATVDGVINKVSWTGRWVEPNGAFAAGTVGLYQAHSPAFFYVKGSGSWINADTLGVAHMPGGFATPNSHGLGISKSTKHPDVAWDLVKMVTNEKWAYTFGITQKVLSGVTKADAKILEYFGKEEPLGAAVLRTQLEHLEKLVATWPQAKDAEIKEAFYSEVQATLLGRKKAAEALAEAERKVNRILR
ncbi:MAG: sugar ABC transporter substrate-binding protein [Candidatus Rokubacteria bacterium]|nr:sugar ABC transporter substrate-binding protein [Candidatus Rokubacteria bacterium]